MPTFYAQPARRRLSTCFRRNRHKIMSLVFLLAVCSNGVQAQTPAQVSLIGPTKVRLGGYAQYSASVNGVAGTILWSVNGFAGGTGSAGSISASGLYSPAATIFAGHSVTVTAKTASAPASSASLTVKVLNPLPIFASGYVTQTAPGTSYLLDIQGSGFVSASQLQIGGANVASVFISSTELQSGISLPAGTTTVAVGILNPNAEQSAPVDRTLPVQAAPTIPTLTVSPSSVLFGNVTVNTPSTQTVTLTSTGTAPVIVNSESLNGTGFTMSGATFPVTLNPGLAVTLDVEFDPAATGAATGQLVIRSNSSTNSTAVSSLSGMGSSASSAYWLAPSVGSVNALGTMIVPTSGKATVQLLSPTITGNRDSLVCVGTSWNSAGTSLTITYTMGTATVHVVVQVTPTSAGVNAQLDADQAVIASVDMGSWAANLSTQTIAVPYYTGDVWYAPSLPAYVNGWWDWHTTQATWLNGTAARYLAKTDGTFNKLHELMEVAASANVDAVLPAPGNAASPYMSTLSGRTVLDIWDEGFSEIEQGLSDLRDYGITNCVAIIHNWQSAGYDNALPEHYPANPSLGGGTGLQAAIAQGRANGCLMAVHENYVDYYPNYPDFNAAAVALNSDGSQMLAWLNPSSGIQSLATKSSLMVANAQKQSPLIHASYGTTADYLDVNSAAQPSSYGDMDASSPLAGMQAAYVQNSQALWAYERNTHNGPVLGEGADHWYYSGLLDGVEAQLGAGGIPANSDASLPLFVDFDLLQIHPSQVNHGMGYYSRWTLSGTWSMTTAQMDAYRMQEIAFGHAPFLTTGTWNNIPLAFTESNLVPPVAASYGTAQATSIQYLVNGSWTSSSVAALSRQFTQVQVAYNSGLTLVANASATPLAWKNLTIPEYGWAAESANVLAYTAQCGSTICDYAQTATSIFANSRNQSDAEIGWGYAGPSVAGMKQGSGRSFTVTYDWLVYRSLGTQSNYASFVHFVDDSQASDANAGIVFQGDYQPTPATSLWQVGQTVSDGPVTVTIPSSVPDGTYSIRVGLYDQATGERLLLSGNNDGTERYIVGYLTINSGGTQVSFTAPAPLANDPRLNAAGTVVNFGTVQTDGMISITQDNGQWVLRPYPRNRNFKVLLNTTNFPTPTIVQAAGSSSSTVVPVDQGTWWQLPLIGKKTYSWPVN